MTGCRILSGEDKMTTNQEGEEMTTETIYNWAGTPRKAGRPAIYGHKQQSVTFSCPRELVRQIELQALSRGISRSRAIVALIEEGINAHER